MCAYEKIKSDLWEKGQSQELGKWATVYQKVSPEVKNRELQPTRTSIGKTTFPKTQESWSLPVSWEDDRVNLTYMPKDVYNPQDHFTLGCKGDLKIHKYIDERLLHMW